MSFSVLFVTKHKENNVSPVPALHMVEKGGKPPIRTSLPSFFKQDSCTFAAQEGCSVVFCLLRSFMTLMFIAFCNQIPQLFIFPLLEKISYFPVYWTGKKSKSTYCICDIDV